MPPGRKMLGFGLAATAKGIFATHVFTESPAARAGIKPGDLIETIDGKSTVGMSGAAFQAIVQAGDVHELSVRTGDAEPRTVSLTAADSGSFKSSAITGGPVGPLLVKVGEPAPDFEATGLDGRKIKLSELQGRPVLINFTATWCGPCKVETPKLVEAYATYHPRGLEMISVYLDAADKDIPAYAKGLGATWPIFTDGRSWQNKVAQTYGITGVPTNILVGKDGKIVTLKFRMAQGTSELESLLKAE